MKFLDKFRKPRTSGEQRDNAEVKNLIDNLVQEKGWVVFATRLHADEKGEDKLSSYMVVSNNYKPADLDIAIREYEKLIDGHLTPKQVSNVVEEPKALKIDAHELSGDTEQKD